MLRQYRQNGVSCRSGHLSRSDEGVKLRLRVSNTGATPGAQTRLVLGEDAFRYYDPGNGRWLPGSGNFSVLVGSSSRDIRLRGQIERWKCQYAFDLFPPGTPMKRKDRRTRN